MMYSSTIEHQQHWDEPKLACVSLHWPTLCNHSIHGRLSQLSYSIIISASEPFLGRCRIHHFVSTSIFSMQQREHFIALRYIWNVNINHLRHVHTNHLQPYVNTVCQLFITAHCRTLSAVRHCDHEVFVSCTIEVKRWFLYSRGTCIIVWMMSHNDVIGHIHR